jgi:hypothetical protein
MRKHLRLILILLILPLACDAQVSGPVKISGPFTISNAGSAPSVTGGDAWLQTTSSTTTGNATWTLQGTCGASNTATCTFPLVASTTALSDLVAGIVTDGTQSLTILSAYSCPSSGGCNAGNAIDTFSLTPSSGSHVNTAADNIDVATVAGGAGGANYITVNLSTTPTGNAFYEFTEMLPPKCGASTCSSSLDTWRVDHGNSGTCSSGCTGGTMTLTGTDAVVGIIDSNGLIDSSNVTYDSTGNVFVVDATSWPGYQILLGGYYTISFVAFKSAGGSYTPSNNFFTPVNLPLTVNPVVVHTACASPCSFTPAASTSGDLIFLGFEDTTASVTISSVTGRGTWVIPSAASSCQYSSGSIPSMGCAYTTSTGGSGAITVTYSGGSGYVSYYEVGRTSGSWTAPITSFSSSPGLTTVQAPSVSLPTVAVCFDQNAWSNTNTFSVGNTLDPFPGGSNFFQYFSGVGPTGDTAETLNTKNGTAPQFLLSASGTAAAAWRYCFD